MWNAFAGYQDIYGKPPPARLVRRVRLWIAAREEKRAEDNAALQKDLDEQKRQVERERQRAQMR